MGTDLPIIILVPEAGVVVPPPAGLEVIVNTPVGAGPATKFAVTLALEVSFTVVLSEYASVIVAAEPVDQLLK